MAGLHLPASSDLICGVFGRKLPDRYGLLGGM